MPSPGTGFFQPAFRGEACQAPHSREPAGLCSPGLTSRASSRTCLCSRGLTTVSAWSIAKVGEQTQLASVQRRPPLEQSTIRRGLMKLLNTEAWLLRNPSLVEIRVWGWMRNMFIASVRFDDVPGRKLEGIGPALMSVPHARRATSMDEMVA
jgi:hypothetical protein